MFFNCCSIVLIVLIPLGTNRCRWFIGWTTKTCIEIGRSDRRHVVLDLMYSWRLRWKYNPWLSSSWWTDINSTNDMCFPIKIRVKPHGSSCPFGAFTLRRRLLPQWRHCFGDRIGHWIIFLLIDEDLWPGLKVPLPIHYETKKIIWKRANNKMPLKWQKMFAVYTVKKR